MLIPKRIHPHFKTTFQKTKSRDNILIEGMLTCCGAHDFEIFVVGEIQRSVFSRICLLPDNDKAALEVRCRKCGKCITVFDSSCDGYEQCANNHSTNNPQKHIACKKCLNDSFCVTVRYEYPDIHELKELEISEIDNAFTWIWITLECKKCGTKYKNFIDYETA